MKRNRVTTIYILNNIALNLTFKELGRLFTMMLSNATFTRNSSEVQQTVQLHVEEEIEMRNIQ